MLNLALCILFSSLIFVLFKLFSRFGIETMYAIVFNYVVACVTGLAFYAQPIAVATIPKKPWFLGTVLLGVLFIVVFNLMAATAQRAGVSVASVATKMSLAIPVLFGVMVYGEHLSAFQVTGVVLALAAVYFASLKATSTSLEKTPLLLPLLVFLGSGIIDTSIKYIQEVHMNTHEYPLFSATVFASAAITGFVAVLLRAIKTPLRFNLRNVLGGTALGILNYFSIYFLLKALEQPNLNSASVFTINNVAIVMFSTLLGILLFKERISMKNWGGIALAVISIIMVALF